MRYHTCRWLAGPVLALAVLGAVFAQSPGTWTPLATPSAPTTGPGGSAVPGPGSTPGPGQSPGLPASRPGAPVIEIQGDLLRYTRNLPGDVKPVLIDADQISTWNEDGRVVLLLQGQVLVQQSVAQTRFPQGVVWIDLNRYRTTGILHLDLYAEGGVRLDTTLETREGKRAVLDLTTRGEFRLRAHKGKVNRQDSSTDPLVLRARSLGVGPKQPTGTPPAPVVPASTSSGSAGASPSPPPAPTLVPAGGPPSNPPPPMGGGLKQMSFEKKTPGPQGPAPTEFVLAQATESAPISPGSVPSGPPARVERPVPLPPIPDLPRPPRPDSNEPPDPPPPDPPPSGGVPASKDGARTSNAVPGPPVPPPSKPAVPKAAPLPKNSPPRQYRILPRSGDTFDVDDRPDGTGRHVITVTKGVILNVRNVPKIGSLDVEADRAVIWTKDNDTKQTAANLQSPQGESSTELEFYLAGHVILRVQDPAGKDKSVLEADELYYDTNRNVAVALNSRLQLQSTRFNPRSANLTEPIVLTAREMLQTSESTFEAFNAEVFSSKLLSDPGLKLIMAQATLVDQKKPKFSLFGQPVIDPKTGKQLEVEQSIIEGRNVFAELEGVPFFYTPYLITDARDPMGPLQTITVGGNRIFGFQGGVGLDVFKLFGVEKPDNTRWRLYLDYMSRRGPGIGSNYTYFSKLFPLADPCDLDAPTGLYTGEVRVYGIHDDGTDILGAQPQPYFTFNPPGYRGRAMWRQAVFDLPEGFNVINQMSLQSDRNFLQEYFKREFDTDPNQANFIYVKQQQDIWAWSGLAQVRTAPFLTTTQWLPRADGYLLGLSLFDIFTSNTQVSAGYARLSPSSDPDLPIAGTNIPSFPVEDPTTRRVSTGRFSVFEELSAPFTLGAFRVVPYAKGMAADYTSDLDGSNLGRFWGGGGLRASVPFSRLYPEVQSELFNVNALYHKIVLSGDYFYARSNNSYLKVAQLDRLNDDSSAQARREIQPQEPSLNGISGYSLAVSPLFDPQVYAIRRMIDNRIDTLNDIDVLRLDLFQRLQTKRGYPGAEHIIDWMSLNTSISYFPQTSQNLGKSWSFLEYQYLWNIGDRTAIESTGWYDPQPNGPRVFTVGLFLNRPDRTNFYIGYRQIDPLQSRVVTGSVTYQFSPKYAMTFTSSYDFGTTQALNNTLLFTRMGTDLQVSLGFTYNSIQNNFGVVVEVVPTLVPINQPGVGALSGPGGLFNR
jgi:hypothetical protein